MKKEHKPTLPNVDYVSDFSVELANIDKLEQTPNLMKGMAIQALDAAINAPGVQTTVKKLLENNKTGLENISNKSIKDNFRVIYAQMCILAVSSLEATLKKYFENALNGFNGINLDNKDLENIKITLAELVRNKLAYRGEFGSLVLEKVKPNFQDLQTIKRNFENYLSKNVTLEDEVEKKICFYLELRHVLVHKGGIVDKKFVNATNSFSANVKNYIEGERVEIDTNDWAVIKDCFTKLVKETTKYIKQ